MDGQLALQGRRSGKKGAGVWFTGGLNEGIAALKLDWVYNWGPAPENQCIDLEALPFLEFVPMVENSDCDEEDKLEVVKKWSSSAVLGFNEPDVGDKSLSVEEALRLWEKLQPLSGRLGSPATAANPTDEGSWLQQFMEGCKERGLRVDFIALHWYGWDPSLWEDTHAQLEEFKRAVQGVHDKFQLPLWVTEYSLIGWGSDPPTYPTPEVEARFAAASAEWMNSVPFVEKFAWFALPNGLWEDSKREPTGVGRAYRDAR